LRGGRLFRQFARSSTSESESEEVKTTGPAFEPADDNIFQLLASCSSSEEDRLMTLGLEPPNDDLFQRLASCSSSEDRMMTSGLEPADDGDEEDRAAPDVSRGKVGAMAGDRKAEAEGN
jgi:hypothetical protein